MKKGLFIIISVIIVMCVLIIGYVLSSWNKNEPCVPEIPQKLENISSEAVWIGGCDGGHWFEVLETNPEMGEYRVKIYFDHNGEVFANEVFAIDVNCKTKFIRKQELIGEILTYDGHTIQTRIVNCNLFPKNKRWKDH